ncbi:MAG: ATP-binding cassette domain-containing protein [bacterium]
MIRVTGVWKRFDDRPVLRGVDLEVPDGEAVVILGASGIGKSVLLRVIAGLLPADSGTVSYDGCPLSFGLLAAGHPAFGQIGYVFQGGALFDSLTVYDNVALPLRETRRLTAPEVRARVRSALARTGMVDCERLMPAELSGGMTRLVAIARALAADPKYVFYDEPTTGLDPVMRGRVLELIVGLRRVEGMTSVIVTHDLAAAEQLADRIQMLREGRLVSLEGARREHYEPQGA